MPEIIGLLRYPFYDRQWLVKMLVGAVIILIPVVNIISLGYFLRCANMGQRGRHCMPDWYDWKEYFSDGCMVLFITLIYIVIPLGIGIIVITIPVVGTSLSFLLFLIVSAFIPMALANYALHQNLRDALMIIEIFRQISRVLGVYTIAYFAALLISLASIALLVTIPMLGLLIGLIIFYTNVVFFHLLGCLHREAF